MPSFPPIVDAAWLAGHLSSVVVADVRWYVDGRSGRAAYETGHLPRAVFVDVDGDLATPGAATDGRHPLPSPEAFAAALGRLGIGADDQVVAYDDTGGMTAGRLVWMLRTLDRSAALLDGGLAAWSGPLEQGPGTPRRPVVVPAVSWPTDRVATVDEVAAATARGSAALIDARSPERFEGRVALVDNVPGHIPGARNAPWTANLGDGCLRDPDELRSHYGTLGIDDSTKVIAYCGSGVSACLDLLALEVAGHRRAKLFPASWSGWSADAERPVATGPQ
jgi:thiosulfate/3-mercaptopyruvate sulfurtransferase